MFYYHPCVIKESMKARHAGGGLTEYEKRCRVGRSAAHWALGRVDQVGRLSVAGRHDSHSDRRGYKRR